MDNLPPIDHGGKAGRVVIATALHAVESVVGHYFPDALDPLKAALAVAGVGCLAENLQPTTLIFLARSGAGKTLVLSLLMPEDLFSPLAKFVYRSDKFTAASFVSHRADVKKGKLGAIDLLPRLKGKTLLTPELAPIFNGKRDELVERFTVLTRVLDGQGFMSDSGAHGRRGYSEPINFQWLGASTPLQGETLEVMAQLGPRMLFYDADRPSKSTKELIAVASGPHTSDAIVACREAVRTFLLTLLTLRPPSSVASSIIAIPAPLLHFVVLWAQVLTRLRATVQGEDVTVEHPERVLGMLKNFALGSALAHGRSAVTEYDLAQVGHIALSSGIAGRGRVFRALVVAGGSASTSNLVSASGLSRPTVLKHMRGLAAVGLVTVTMGAGKQPDAADVVSDLAALCSAPLHKAKGGEGGNDAA